MNREQIVVLMLMIANAVAGALVAARPETLGLDPHVQAWIGIAQIAIGTMLGFLKSIVQHEPGSQPAKPQPAKP